MLGRHRDGAQGTTQRQRTRITHEDHGGRCIEPQEAEPGPDDGAADDGKFARPLDEVQFEIVRKIVIADEVDDEPEARRGNHHRNDCEAIKPVRHVHRITGTNHHEHAHEDEEQAEVNEQFLEEGHGKRGGQRLVADPHEDADSEAGNDEFGGEPHPAGEPLCGRLGDLEVVVVEADGAEAQRHEQHGPDIEVAQIRPEQRAHEDA